MTSEHTPPADARAAIAAHTNWYHRIEVAPGVITPGINDSQRVLELLGLPADLHGKRVLDIGTRDGFFAFECERRGAEVIAVDYLPADQTGFAIASRLLGSRVPYVRENVYHLTQSGLGTFDVVLMLGLLYHLRDPLGALDIVRDLCAGQLFLETHVCDDAFTMTDGTVAPLASVLPSLVQSPIMQFCPGTLLNDDPTNFWAPNTACVESLLREASFEVVDTVRNGSRSIFRAQAVANANLLYHRDIARGTRYPDGI